MSYTDIGIQSAKRQQSQAFNVRRFVRTLLDQDAEFSVEEVIHALRDHVQAELAKGNGEPLYVVCDYAASNNYEALRKQRKPRAPAAAIDETYKEAVVHQVRVNVLMSVILPTGRTLYDSTREEIAEFHGHLNGLIEKLQPGQTPRQAGITVLGP
jgi:hypothetical protein